MRFTFHFQDLVAVIFLIQLGSQDVKGSETTKMPIMINFSCFLDIIYTLNQFLSFDSMDIQEVTLIPTVASETSSLTLLILTLTFNPQGLCCFMTHKHCLISQSLFSSSTSTYKID